MMRSLVITLNGDDRTGIVESVSRIIVQYQGEWIESRMANLSGKFAGILRANLPEEHCEQFSAELKSSVPDLNITIERIESEPVSAGQKSYKLELLGQDRPGIIHRISSLLVQNGATVEELESEVIEASMSGEHLFKASISLMMENDQSIDKLQTALEELANELIVDIELG